MDVRDIVALVSVAFGAGGFSMGTLVTRYLLSNLQTKIAEDRRKDADELKEWVETRFQRKLA